MGILKSSIVFYNGLTAICRKAINSFATDKESGFSVMLNVILNPDANSETDVAKAKKTLNKILKKATKFIIWHDSSDDPELIKARADEFKSVLEFVGDTRKRAIEKTSAKGTKYNQDLTEVFRRPKAVEASPEVLKKAIVALSQR
mgnify:CR=1 FL=1|tara:strand:- start:954 stop:1388 length:435 start_codon:yes stop_codon:yes gene_type:complete